MDASVAALAAGVAASANGTEKTATANKAKRGDLREPVIALLMLEYANMVRS
jgi:hypothetical protein